MIAEGDHLQSGLGGEDAYEGQVDEEEDFLLLLALVVRLHHHGDHVEHDQRHDQDVEELLGHQVKDQARELVL